MNQDLWYACAGPLVSLPPAGSLVVYFPQGHSEQVYLRAAALLPVILVLIKKLFAFPLPPFDEEKIVSFSCSSVSLLSRSGRPSLVLAR